MKKQSFGIILAAVLGAGSLFSAVIPGTDALFTTALPGTGAVTVQAEASNSFGGSGSEEDDSYQDFAASEFSLVLDEADLLTDEEESQLLDKLEAIGNAYNMGKADIYASLAGLWEIKELQGFTVGALVWTALALLWPLKRAIQGMLALIVGVAPKALSALWCGLALLAALAAQGGVLALLLARQP